MKRRTVLSTALTAGAIIFTLNAGLYLTLIVADAIQQLQAGRVAGGGSQPSAPFQLPLMLLTAAAVIALPIGLWACVLRRHAVAKRLSVTSAPHGKYLPWGRNLRRHASLPARYGSLRSQKSLRPTRRHADHR